MLCSLKDLYRIGPGPSSSHTIGPYRICQSFLKEINDNKNYHFIVTLFGSLALTGKGHLTDKIIKDVLKDCEVIFDLKNIPEFPNTMKIQAFLDGKLVKEEVYFSLGGGQIAKKDGEAEKDQLVYPFSSFKEVRDYIEKNEMSYMDFVKKYEGESIEDYLKYILSHMEKEIENGLVSEGYIAGKLHIKRIAPLLYKEAQNCLDADKRDLYISTYAYAVSESNAAGSLVVTSPTCGSAGVLPSVLYYLKKQLNYKEDKLIDALIVAGLIGTIIKRNATISGAVGGCQAEIGSATSMAAGALCAADGLSFDHIEYASEMALEHQLGLTCDPVGGYVAIPCIERNSISAIKAFNSYVFAKHLVPYRHNAISLDEVIAVMKETGKDLSADYKETAKGGLAKIHKF